MPGRPPYKNEAVQRWTAAIAQSDGFIFVTPEYNYGPAAVLKNAIDWVYPEWNRKVAGFVSYGSALGARSVQQLRETAEDDRRSAVVDRSLEDGARQRVLMVTDTRGCPMRFSRPPRPR